jgi:hypothetical protein
MSKPIFTQSHLEAIAGAPTHTQNDPVAPEMCGGSDSGSGQVFGEAH